MKFAKPHLDIGLFTNHREAQLEFWQGTIGLEFDHLAKLGGGVHQLRHHVNGSILKINHARATLRPDAIRAGWRELLIARENLSEAQAYTDPDGNQVTLVPVGHEGVQAIGIRMKVRSLARSLQFYREAMQFAPSGANGVICGDSVLVLSEDREAGLEPPYAAPGYRYTTVQVFDCEAEHAGILARGGREGRAPRTIGTTTRYSFVLDPDGNWIEISERFELTEPGVG